MEKTTREQELNISGEHVLVFIRKDFPIIILCLLVALFCVYTLYNVESYKEACNDYWVDALEQNNCINRCAGHIKNFTLPNNIMGVYQNASQDQD